MIPGNSKGEGFRHLPGTAAWATRVADELLKAWEESRVLRGTRRGGRFPGPPAGARAGRDIRSLPARSPGS